MEAPTFVGAFTHTQVVSPYLVRCWKSEKTDLLVEIGSLTADQSQEYPQFSGPYLHKSVMKQWFADLASEYPISNTQVQPNKWRAAEAANPLEIGHSLLAVGYSIPRDLKNWGMSKTNLS